MNNFFSGDPHTRPLLFFILILALLTSCTAPLPTTSPPPVETALPSPSITPPSSAPPTAAPPERISQPGKYKGYTQPLYSGRSSTSQYITMRDGTKLAALILRPTLDGEPVTTPLPVVWAHNRYHRESIFNYHWLFTLLQHGYIIASVDVRGTGASFGTFSALFSPEETRDAYDITEWLAAQPWSDGNIGMYGRSYLGGNQYMAASTAPPHLKAIFPEMAEFDHYSFVYPGGIFHDNFFRHWGATNKHLDANGSAVDADWGDQAMLQAALKEHAANIDVYETYASWPYRDSVSPQTGKQPFVVNNVSTYVKEIRDAAIPVYYWAGWNDMFPKDALLWYRNNLGNPQKITIGPWSHSQLGSLDLATEELRWYDYWLKGIDNGIMSEAPINYYTLGKGTKSGWHTAWEWPLPEEQPTNYYFDGVKTGSVDSVNDGGLSTAAPAAETAVDEYRVDYTTTSGTGTRWTAGYDYMSPVYPNTMMFNDEKGLTYTTPPLTAEVEVTGHPVLHLWITASAKDVDFFVYLEDISPGKLSNYITEGSLRASHRALSTPPYEYLGLPFHRGTAADIAPLPNNQPVELVFDLLPTSYIFAPGHRIRVTITNADKDTALTPQLDPPPTVQLYRDAAHPSYITLPIIP